MGKFMGRRLGIRGPHVENITFSVLKLAWAEILLDHDCKSSPNDTETGFHDMPYMSIEDFSYISPWRKLSFQKAMRLQFIAAPEP